MENKLASNNPPARSIPSYLPSAVLIYIMTILAIPSARLLANLPIFGDDYSSHYLAVSRFIELLQHGETDFFMPEFNLGFPMYLYYQPLPHVVVAALYFLTLGLIPLQIVFNFSVMALWTLYPLTTYVGVRRFGFDQLTAMLCAVVAPLIMSVYPFGFACDSIIGPGLYTQLFAMTIFPLGVGTLWRALDQSDRRSLIFAAMWFVALCLSHFFYGVVLLTISALMIVVQPRSWRVRTRRLLIIAIIVGVTLLFWLIPLFETYSFIGGWPWGRAERKDGYGLPSVIDAIVRGGLLDNNRGFPFLTVGLAIGFLAMLFTSLRKEPRCRAVIACLVVFLFFLAGRRTFGQLVLVQPANQTFELFRYIGPVHAFAVIVTGIGFAALGRVVARFIHPIVAVAVLISIFVAPIHKLVRFQRGYFRTIDQFPVKEPDLKLLGAAVDQAVASGAHPGRIYAHGKLDTASHFVAHALARHTEQPMGPSYAVGMHDSLSSYYLEFLDPYKSHLMALYNFRFVLSSASNGYRRDSVQLGAVHLLDQADVSLYELTGQYGYFALVEPRFVLEGSPHQVRPVVLKWLASSYPEARYFGTIGSHGFLEQVPHLRARGTETELFSNGDWNALAAQEFFAEKHQPARVGTVLSEQVYLNTYRAKIDVESEGFLALKVTYHPWWQVTIDGESAIARHLTPSFLGVAVLPGEHEVVFRFRNPPYQKLLLCFSILLWLGLFSTAAPFPRRIVEKICNRCRTTKR